MLPSLSALKQRFVVIKNAYVHSAVYTSKHLQVLYFDDEKQRKNYSVNLTHVQVFETLFYVKTNVRDHKIEGITKHWPKIM